MTPTQFALLFSAVLQASFVRSGSAEQTFPSGSQLTPTVTSSVGATNEPGVFLYSYILSNSQASRQAADKLVIQYDASLSPTIIGTPTSWLANERLGDAPLAGWTSLTRGLVNPGRHQGGFALRASGLPGIVQGFVSGFVSVSQLPKFEEGRAPADFPGSGIVDNSVKVRVVGPIPPPQQFQALEFLESLIKQKEEAHELGWIDRSGILISLDAKLNAARASLGRNNTIAARNQLAAFLSEVDAQAGKHLSAEAVVVLKFNAQYLLAHLK